MIQIHDILKYKEENNLSLPVVAKKFGVGVNKLRKIIHSTVGKTPKKRVKKTPDTIAKIVETRYKNGTYSKYDWNAEYQLFIEMYNKDNSLGMRKFCKNRGYDFRYLRKYIQENRLPQPKGIPTRTTEWKNNISVSTKGKILNPYGSNGKLRGKKLSKTHRDNIQSGLVKHWYDISLDEWNEMQGDRKTYYNEVWRITLQQPLHELENYDKRGNAGKDGAYQIDHIYPISKGFMNEIPAEKIGDIKNLQMLPWKENRKKGARILSSINA